MKMVNIKCTIDATAGTIESALEEIKEHLMHQYHAALNPNLATDYRKWNDANDGDVDWTPFFTDTARTKSEIRIKNV